MPTNGSGATAAQIWDYLTSAIATSGSTSQVNLPAGSYGIKVVFDACNACNLNNFDWLSFTGGPTLAAALADPLLVPVRIALPDVNARYLRINPAPRWLARELKVLAPE